MPKKAGTKKAVVTGVAKSNHGTAICRKLLHAGYSVMGIDQEPLARSHPLLAEGDKDFHYIVFDFRKICESRNVLLSRIQEFHRGEKIDVFVHNAEIGIPFMPAEREDRVKHWEDVLHMNLTVPFILTEIISEDLNEGGSVVYISNAYANQSDPNCEAYSASKAGLRGLAMAQANTFRDRLRINLVLAGNSEYAESPEDRMYHQSFSESIAEATFFLACEKQSGFITGQSIVLDSGKTARLH